ncbi:MAG: hypothetical protein ACI4TK_16225 [Agathobacter sp.]
MDGQEKSTKELLKEIEYLRKTIEVQKRTINTLINQYVLKSKKNLTNNAKNR